MFAAVKEENITIENSQIGFCWFSCLFLMLLLQNSTAQLCAS